MAERQKTRPAALTDKCVYTSGAKEKPDGHTRRPARSVTKLISNEETVAKINLEVCCMRLRSRTPPKKYVQSNATTKHAMVQLCAFPWCEGSQPYAGNQRPRLPNTLRTDQVRSSTDARIPVAHEKEKVARCPKPDHSINH